MVNQELVGVILAAGRGSRMAPLSETWPKPLLPICNKPMVQYQIEALQEAGVKRVFIVVGHLKEAFERWLPAFPSIEVEYIEQVSPLGIAHAVLQLEPYVNAPFILLLGDVFFVPLSFHEMVTIFREKDAGGVLAARVEDDPEMIRRNFAIVQDDEGRVRRVIEKPRHVPNRLKGCGIYLFDGSVFDSIRRTPRTAMRDEYEITDSIQMFIDDGAPVYVWPEIRWDMNITNPRDLLQVNLLELEKRGVSELVGDDVRAGEGVALDRVVVGAGVRFAGSARLTRTVVLPGTQIEDGATLTNCLATPEGNLEFPDLVLPSGSQP